MTFLAGLALTVSAAAGAAAADVEGEAAGNTLADAQCVARLMDLPPPDTAPVVKRVAWRSLLEYTVAGYPGGSWARMAGPGAGVFRGDGVILIAAGPPLHRSAYAHELAHYALWWNRRPYHHDNGGEADRLIRFVERKFWTWCR